MALQDDLQAAFAEAQRLIARGVADRRSPFHAPTLATLGLDGTPRLRTVILRGYDAARRELRFHTDRRSAKIEELAHVPRAAIHVYDPAARIQVRLEGMCTVHVDDAVAQQAWLSSQPMSRVCYGTQPAPGSAIDAVGAFALPVSPEEIEAGRAHFAAVLCTVERLEWLHLAHKGHRRARFRLSGGDVEGEWLAP